MFKGKFIAALDAAAQSGRLRLDPACDDAERQQRRQALQAKPWVVYAKTALAGPAALLGYLSRYTQRTAISNERLPDIRGDAVRPTTRVNGKHGQPNGRTVTRLDGVEFVRRLLQHVVPSGFNRIRHYGLLAPAAKTQRLAAERQLPGMPAATATQRPHQAAPRPCTLAADRHERAQLVPAAALHGSATRTA